MDNLFLLLFLVCLVATIVGVIKPQIVVRWGDTEKRNRKNVLKYYGIGLVVFFILFSITTNNTANTATTNKNDSSSKSTAVSNKKELTPEQKAAAEKAVAEKAAADKIAAEKAAKEKAAVDKAAAKKAAAEKAAKEKEERIGYETGITYEQLARTPDKFKGKKAKFTGKVIQVMEDSGETQLRIAVNDDYDTVLIAGYESNITSTRVLENDNVTVRGKSLGLITYKSTIGGNITIPGIVVDKIDINK